MAEKHQQHVQGYPLAPSNVVPRSDQESTITSHQSHEEMKRKKRVRFLAYIAVFAVLQAAVILVLALVLGRVRTPNVRLEDVTLASGGGGNNNVVRFAARVVVRNRNFGRYKFDDSMATIRSSGGATVGQFVIPERRVNMRSTRRYHVVADLSPVNASGTALTVEATLRGKVEFVRVLRRRRTARMNCHMTVDLPSNGVQDLRCN